jgi:hypothetical protein
MCFKINLKDAASLIREAALFFKGNFISIRGIYYFSLLFRYFNSYSSEWLIYSEIIFIAPRSVQST